MKVHDDQLRESDTGSPPLKYSPRVLVSTLPESWLITLPTCHGDADHRQRPTAHTTCFLEISFITHSTEEKTRFGPKAAARPVRNSREEYPNRRWPTQALRFQSGPGSSAMRATSGHAEHDPRTAALPTPTPSTLLIASLDLSPDVLPHPPF
jgi:hypothetical protein